MIEWQKRIIDIYGNHSAYEYNDIVKELNSNYKNLNDNKLNILKKKYQFDYVVLYKDTITKFPIVYSSPNYKVIKVD